MSHKFVWEWFFWSLCLLGLDWSRLPSGVNEFKSVALFKGNLIWSTDASSFIKTNIHLMCTIHINKYEASLKCVVLCPVVVPKNIICVVILFSPFLHDCLSLHVYWRYLILQNWTEMKSIRMRKLPIHGRVLGIHEANRVCCDRPSEVIEFWVIHCIGSSADGVFLTLCFERIMVDLHRHVKSGVFAGLFCESAQTYDLI